MTTAEHELPVGPAQPEAELAARLHALEAQPLAERADGYVQLHDEMRERLEGGDAAGTQA